MNSQKITLFVLLIVSFVLIIEFLRGGGAFSARKTAPKKPKNEKEAAAKDTIQKMSAADSIAKLYSPMVFRDEQMKHERVKKAYKAKGDTIRMLYQSKKLDENSLQIYIRAFKKEEIVEVWAKDKNKPAYLLLNSYKFCKNSGTLGPKRKKGDNQIPEGFYHIDRFNHQSNFYLSLGLNYPNKIDKIVGDSTDLGGDIFIHGGCATVGCIPITDDKIQELYIMAVDAKACGQKKIPVTIFPARLSEANFNTLKKEYASNPKLIQFWKSLKDGYQAFEKCQQLPLITLTTKGEYICKADCE